MRAAAAMIQVATCLLAAAVPLQAPRSSLQLARAPMLLIPEFQYPDRTPPPTSMQWVGLFEARGGYELRSAQVTLAPINECGETDRAARQITVAGPSQPILIVQAHHPSLPRWRLGPLGPAIGRTGIAPGDHRDIRTRSGVFRLAASGSGSGGNVYEYALRLIDRRTGISQLLFAYTPPPGAPRELHQSPYLVWMGDLDRDGRADLLVEDAMSEIAEHWVLYLSSAARGRNLVGRVAEFERGSC